MFKQVASSGSTTRSLGFATGWHSYKRLRSEAAAFKVLVDGETFSLT